MNHKNAYNATRNATRNATLNATWNALNKVVDNNR